MNIRSNRIRVIVAEHQRARAAWLHDELEHYLNQQFPGARIECAAATSRIDALRRISEEFDVIIVDWIWAADDDPDGDEKYPYGAEIARAAKEKGMLVGVVTQVEEALVEARSDPNVDFALHRSDIINSPKCLTDTFQLFLEQSGVIVGEIDQRRVFLVYGNLSNLSAVREFLKDLDLVAVPFNTVTDELVDKYSVDGGRPVTTLDVVQHATSSCAAVLVLMTADDEVIDSSGGTTRRARQNVIFEAGLAFAKLPGRTLLVKFGDVEEFSDVDGVQYLKLTNSLQAKRALRDRLVSLGLPVSDGDEVWRRKRYKFAK